MNFPRNVTELLQELVKIPSVNPHGMASGMDPEFLGEQRCAEFVGSILEALGASVEIQAVHPGRPNVIGRFQTDRPGKPLLLFVPHLDTVSVAGMTIDPFGAELRDGKMFGRGTSDTKGPMAAMLWALSEMRNQIPSMPYEIWFAGMMGEEAGQDGAKAFVKALLADPERTPERIFALIGEPTDRQIVYTTKGAAWIRVATRGKSVHSSQPDRGENAIYKMADIVQCISREIAPLLQTITDPVLGNPTISLGMIEGGTKTNIVPDLCKAEIDVRTIPGQNISTIITKLQQASPGAQVYLAQSSAPLQTDPHHPLIEKLKQQGAQCVSAPWFCDAAVFSAAKIPAVAAGPGNIAQAHTEDEWIAIDELDRGVEFYRSFLMSL